MGWPAAPPVPRDGVEVVLAQSGLFIMFWIWCLPGDVAFDFKFGFVPSSSTALTIAVTPQAACPFNGPLTDLSIYTQGYT